jgi:SAM-dependent methyltransferase
MYCLKSETHAALKAEIKQRFMKVALAPQEEKRFPVGPASAKQLGYDADQIDALPSSMTESFAGVGNPITLSELRAGQTVLDLGCGAGLDCILAARKVGPSGKVIGVDFAIEMVQKAMRNVEIAGVTNAEFRQGEADALPVVGGSVDLIISNGVFNLCLDKPRMQAEAFRVLRPGGHIQMADILLEDGVTPEEVARKGAWSD